MRSGWLGLGLAALGVACAGAPAPQSAVPTTNPVITATLDAMEADSVASLILGRLLASEAKLEEPDSLFAEDAVVVADGELRYGVPRLAGVGLGGQLQVVTTRTSVQGSFVWGVLEYRWLPSFENDALRIGIATVIIARTRDGAWRIVHLHSSAPTPEPDAPRPAPPDSVGDAGRGGGIP